MKITRKKIIIFSVLAIVVVIGWIFFSRNPIGRALLKSKSHFFTHSADSRILYEPGAEGFADKIVDFLPEAIERVEMGHYLPFKKQAIIILKTKIVSNITVKILSPIVFLKNVESGEAGRDCYSKPKPTFFVFIRFKKYHRRAKLCGLLNRGKLPLVFKKR